MGTELDISISLHISGDIYVLLILGTNTTWFELTVKIYWLGLEINPPWFDFHDGTRVQSSPKSRRDDTRTDLMCTYSNSF